MLCVKKHALLLKYQVYINAVVELAGLKVVLIPIESLYNRMHVMLLLSPHADRHAGDIYIVYCCLFVCLSAGLLVTDISSVG